MMRSPRHRPIPEKIRVPGTRRTHAVHHRGRADITEAGAAPAEPLVCAKVWRIE